MGTSANIQYSSMRFEPGALASFSARADSGLAAHDNATASPIEYLVARFPVIRRLVGDGFVCAMAGRFIISEPPRSATLLHYGETFPRFLRRLGDTATIEYVADIAALKMARGKAYHAAGALPVGAQAVSSLRPEMYRRRCLALHPSLLVVYGSSPLRDLEKQSVRWRERHD